MSISTARPLHLGHADPPQAAHEERPKLHPVPGSRTASRAMNEARAYAQSSDGDLMAWSAAGDRRAFDEVVTRHGAALLRVAYRLVSSMAVAEEITQEALVRAWEQCSRFEPQRARLSTWLYRIAVNLCIDHRRKVHPEPLPGDFDPVDQAAGVLEELQASQRAAALARAVKELPVRQQAVMALVYEEGLSAAEAGLALGQSTKAVERLLERARAELRACMGSRNID